LAHTRWQYSPSPWFRPVAEQPRLTGLRHQRIPHAPD
jgi:hypothetical protein